MNRDRERVMLEMATVHPFLNDTIDRRREK